MASRRILVTGAAGFIGFHLARALKARGDEVLGVDSYNSYYTPALKQARAALIEKEGVQVLQGDIEDAAWFKEQVQRFQPTHVAHLAAQAGVRYSITQPQAFVRANLTGFLSVLEACRALPAVKLVYASSSSVYGTNGKIPYSVENSTDTPASFYGATKKANEVMAHAYHHLYGIPMVGLRFFTVYGPWGRPDMAYYSFTKAILEGRPIEIYNNGDMSRDFTYIEDIVAGTRAALDRCSGYDLFNLGNDKPVSLRDFVAVLEQEIGKPAVQISKPMQAGDVQHTWADIGLSRERLDYDPKTAIEQGLAQFVAWYRKEGLRFG